jgi:23S rRNA pseudouridine2605 synthase
MARKSGNDEHTTGERIAKAIARAGLCSRREAEAWIKAGRVAVNGAVIASPALNVMAADRIVVDGAPLAERERTRLFLYHKPRGLVTTHADPQQRPTVFGALPKTLPRLISVGRLDASTEGLLLLTNDGGLARALEMPANAWLRRYRVRAFGRVRQDALDALRGGIEIDEVRYGPIEARLEREQGANLWLTFAMREGKNREVKNVLGHLGLKVNRLIRLSFGPFQLGVLPEGAIEEVRTRTLREQLGEKMAALAGADFTAPISHVVPPRAAGAVPPHHGASGSERIDAKRGAGWKRRTRASELPNRPAAPATQLTSGSETKKRAPAAVPLTKRGSNRKKTRDAERFGEPELARREKRNRFRRPRPHDKEPAR